MCDPKMIPKMTQLGFPVSQNVLMKCGSEMNIFFCFRKFPDMPCMKRAYKDKRRRSTGQQPGAMSASRPADKPRVNRGFCSPAGLNRMSLVRASEEMFGTIVFDALGDTRDGFFLRGETCRRPMLPGSPCPAAPLCAARPDPPLACPGFGFDR